MQIRLSIIDQIANRTNKLPNFLVMRLGLGGNSTTSFTPFQKLFRKLKQIHRISEFQLYLHSLTLANQIHEYHFANIQVDTFVNFLRFRTGKRDDSGDYKKLCSKFFRNNICEGNFFREKKIHLARYYLQFNCLEAYA